MHVTVLLAELSSHASASLTLEILDAANRLAAPAEPFSVRVASLQGAAVRDGLGRSMSVDCSLAEIARTDLVIIPGFLFTLRDALPAFDKYRSWLHLQYERGAVIASMCTAAFMLAQAGLLDGIQATTHWAFADLFRRKFPNVRLEEQRILCEEGRIISSAGASSVLDMMLHIVRRFASRELAQQCSRFLLLDGVRTNQSVYITWSMPRGHADGSILKAQDWMEANFEKPCKIDEIAGRFGFGERNFKRRFKGATGYSPLEYLQALRLEKAKFLLETTRLSFESITDKVGYENSNSFRRLFCRRVGMSPTVFRKRFPASASSGNWAETT